MVSQHTHTHLLELPHLSLVDQGWGHAVVGVAVNYPYLEYPSQTAIGHLTSHPPVHPSSCDSLTLSYSVFWDQMWLGSSHSFCGAFAFSSSPISPQIVWFVRSYLHTQGPSLCGCVLEQTQWNCVYSCGVLHS